MSATTQISITEEYKQRLRKLILEVVQAAPDVPSAEIDGEFRTRYSHLWNEQWDKSADEETLWLEHQIRRAQVSLSAPVATDAVVAEVKTAGVLDWALWAASRGWYIFPCDENKHPVTPNGFLDSTLDPELIRSMWTAGTNTKFRKNDATEKNVPGNPKYNYGIDLGKSNLVVRDYDIVAPDPSLPATFRVKTGRIVKEGEDGGYHDYYVGSCATHSIFVPAVEPVVEKEELDKKGRPVVVRYDALGRKVGKHGVTVGEVRSRGAYVIGPGAVHESGRMYEIICDIPLTPSPEQNVEKIQESSVIGSDKQNEIAAFVESAFDKSGISYRARSRYNGGFKWLVDCPWEHNHSGGKSIAEGGSSSAVFVLSSGALDYKCQHAHCEDQSWRELRAWMEKEAGGTLPFAKPTVIIGEKLSEELASPVSATAASVDWSEPRTLDDKLSPVAVFKPEFLPKSIRPWVVDVSERMSVPLDFAGICAINTIAGVIGRRAFVFPKEHDKSWKESLCLSGFVVAESGKMKTPTWKMFTNVVSEKAKDWEASFKEAKSKYEMDLLAWKKAEQKSQAAEKKGDFSFSVPPPPDEPKNSRRLILNDATPEIAHEVMKNNPAGLFYFRDELSGWMAELDKEGRETQLSMFLSAMNGDDTHTVDRIGREGGTAQMCLSVFGGIQPDKFREFLSSTQNIDSGMGPRFALGVWPDDLDLPTVDRTPNDEAKALYRKIIRNAAEMSEEQASFHFDSEAQAAFDHWYEEFKCKSKKETNTGKKSHMSKYKGIVPRLAAIFQLVDQISKFESAMGTIKIDIEHLNQAVNLLVYLETHMHRIYDSAQNAVQKAEIEIAQHIKDRSLKSGFTARDIRRKRWHSLTNVDYVDLALENLQEKSWIREMTTNSGSKGGRPTTCWDINPSLL